MRRFPNAIFGKNTFEVEASYNSLQKSVEDVIMSELGFFTLKTGATFTHREKPRPFATTEDNNPASKKRNILVLIHQYLNGIGYQDTCHTLELESQINLRQYKVCDNIDLNTVVQEFEAYHFAKFQRYPKIVKPLKDLGHKSHWYDIRFSNGMRTVSFPNIDNRHRNITPHCCVKKPGKSAKMPRSSKDTKGNSFSEVDNNVEGSPGLSTQPLHPEIRPTTAGAPILTKQNSFNKRNSIPSSLQGPDDLYDLGRALGGKSFGPRGSSNEWADLMQIISKDIYQANPNVKWGDIVGLDEAKRLIQEAVVYPIKYPQLFQGILSPWRGLLLYGPPGTGKTLLAKAVATECNTTFFNISASSLVSKWRGESEKLVRILFEMARAQAPSTIFLDELDSLMSHRGSSEGSTEHEGSRRMKTELLIQMDGLACSNDLVFVLAASNLPWELDCAMLRRLEKRILVHLPNREARKAMFLQHLPNTVCKSEEFGLELTSNLDYDILAEQSDGYSGSDIRLVCKESAMQRLRQIFDILGTLKEDETMAKDLAVDPITTENVLTAIEHTKPSAKNFAQKYLDWQKQYESA